jgi:heme exporter protein D
MGGLWGGLSPPTCGGYGGAMGGLSPPICGGYGGAIAPHLRGLSPPTLFIRPRLCCGGYGGAIAPHLRALSPPTLFIRPRLCSFAPHFDRWLYFYNLVQDINVWSFVAILLLMFEFLWTTSIFKHGEQERSQKQRSQKQRSQKQRSIFSSSSEVRAWGC